MTNLLEKSLITGFGIFTLTIFFIIITPFFQNIEEYEDSKSREDTLNENLIFINEIDIAIKSIIKNFNEDYTKFIKYPREINVSFNENYVKFDFILDNTQKFKLLYYDIIFTYKFYYNFPSGTYLLNVSYRASLVNVEFKS